MDESRNVLLVKIDLLQQGAEEIAGFEIDADLPKRTRADRRYGRCAGGTGLRRERRLGIVGEDVGVFAFGCGHLLFLLHLREQLTSGCASCRFLEPHLLRGGFHPLFKLDRQVVMTAFEEQAHILDCCA